MTTTDRLREVEADLAALASMPGEIRAKIKAGLAELTRLRDAIDVSIGGVTGRARATLDAIEALATADQKLAAAAQPNGLSGSDAAATPAQPAAGGSPNA